MPQCRTIGVLKKRSEFLAVASHRQRWVTPGFVLQVAPIGSEENEPTQLRGLGLTASKKMVGNKAVDRNRARRRLRALAMDVLPKHAKENMNYILLARGDVLSRAYEQLRQDLEQALKRLKLWQE